MSPLWLRPNVIAAIQDVPPLVQEFRIGGFLPHLFLKAFIYGYPLPIC